MTPLYKSIASDVELALGEVVSAECRRQRVHPRIVARRGEFPDSAVEAFKRGKRQPAT